MLSKLRSHHPSHATVISYVALFVALGGTSAYAANTVFSTDIVDGEVKTPDLATDAVTQAKLRDAAVGRPELASAVVSREKINNGAVDGSKVADNALTGDDVNESSLGLPLRFFVVPNWESDSAGVTVQNGDGNTLVSRSTPGSGFATLPVSYPTHTGDRQLRITAFRVCRHLGPGVTITGYGLALGSGSSPANNSTTTPVSKTGAGCDTIAMADVNEGQAFVADGDNTFKIAVFVSYPAGGGGAQLGGATLTLNP